MSTRSASIYAAIGGAPAVSAAVDDLYRRVLGDPALAAHFAGVDVQRVKAHQRLFVAAALGGPGGYRGRPMREAHSALHLRNDDFDRVVDHLAATLSTLGVDGRTVAEIGAALGPLRAEIVEEPAGAATHG